MSVDLPERPRIAMLTGLLRRHYANAVETTIRDAGFDDLRPGDAKAFPHVPDEGITAGGLALRTGVRKQTMAEAIDRLEGRGYLERRPNPRDRRSHLVFLTDRGRAVRPLAVAAGNRIEQHWAELAGPEELEALRSLLRNLVRLLENEHRP
ncbi:MarR family winged helix-turn-helix transcriptional regulator [Nocardia concava]|uniref:MarR family winged helix-turn-helix transcriptional regulator n=1 Tax=Nocardia concava TaxID=257281 RepID=UPI00059530D6|nr:MarR family transcriptional regulator [Nocardia concava]